MADPSSKPVQVGGDADTVDRYCSLCAARSSVDARVVRAGVTSMTVLVNLDRPSVGPHAVQRSRVLLETAAARAAGAGSSIEEAVVDALDQLEKTFRRPEHVHREPTRIGPHVAPADELDEADDVERRRAWRAAKPTNEEDERT